MPTELVFIFLLIKTDSILHKL